MRTSASEHLSHVQVMARLSSTFSSLIKEQIDAVERLLEVDPPDVESSDIANIVDLAVRLVERSAEWLGLSEVASLALELRETVSQLGQLRPEHREEIVAHCRVALAAEARLAEKLRAEGFGAMVQHAGIVSDAVDQLRAGLSQAKAQSFAASRGVIDEATPGVGPSENLLALTFEIKNSLVHQNERIASMSGTVGETLRTAQSVLSDWEGLVKSVERRRMRGGASAAAGGDAAEAKTLRIHQTLQEMAGGLRTLTQELNQLMSIQYALERRARDLDENLLWEFLDPLDRFVDELYAAASRRDDPERRVVLTIQTGGVGFEPEIGSILLPLLVRLLESAESSGSGTDVEEIRLTGAREGLEARIGLEGPGRFGAEAERALEEALAELGGFATIERLMPAGTSIHLQFPMARSLRSFLIVEAAGQRIAVPWSAVERIHASPEELAYNGDAGATIHALGALLGGRSEESDKPGAVAILRSGSASAIVGFDRIVWRENARLTPLPPRLYPVDEILGGIVAPDNSVTLVLNPSGVIGRLAELGA